MRENLCSECSNILYSFYVILDTDRHCIRETCVQNVIATFWFCSLNLILAGQSKYFRGLFRNDPTEPSVTLDFETATISACLEGMYTGTTPLTYDNDQDTVIAADYLGI